MALQSIWWRDISKDPFFEPLQAKFQPERMHNSRLIVIEARLAHKKMLFHQDNAPSHKSTVAMIKLRIGLWIDSSSTLFSGFGPVWFLSVPKLKNLARWEEILVKWGSRRQWIFCRLWDSLLQMTTKHELCVLSGWNLAWRGSKSGSFEMSPHQMDCSAISWKFTKLIKRPVCVCVYVCVCGVCVCVCV